MAEIPNRLGDGGSFITGERNDGRDLLPILQGIADDLAALKAAAVTDGDTFQTNVAALTLGTTKQES